MNPDYTPSFLIACSDINYLNFIANSFTNSAKLLLTNEDSNNHTQSFHFLVVVAFELFLKVIIGIKMCRNYENTSNITENEIKSEIMKKYISFGHNLKQLFENIPDLMFELGIEEVTKVPNNNMTEVLVSEYRVKMKDCEYPLSIKDVEAVRYGSFAKNKNIFVNATMDNKILELLLNLQKRTEYIVNEEINLMRQTTIIE